MTKKELDKLFSTNVLPYIRKQEQRYKVGRVFKDIPLRCEEYNYLMDSLHRDGELTDKQASTYCIPERYI